MPQRTGSAASREAVVRWCKRHKEGEFLVGTVTSDAGSSGAANSSDHGFDEDLYETLQVHRNADPDMIHRVFRILAGRYHPDNSETVTLPAFGSW
jgi:hypothetical protein